MTLMKWQQKYKEHLMALAPDGMFDEMLDTQIPNDYDIIDHGQWYAETTAQLVRKNYIHNARLAQLVTPELAVLLEQLAIHAPYTLHAGIGIATQARTLAARIREALEVDSES